MHQSNNLFYNREQKIALSAYFRTNVCKQITYSVHRLGKYREASISALVILMLIFNYSFN